MPQNGVTFMPEINVLEAALDAELIRVARLQQNLREYQKKMKTQLSIVKDMKFIEEL